MQELVLNGKTYVKATDIAKHLGYTSDYVGQLCRSGKVDAEQVGRAWYVVPETIHAHKQTRYRTNQVKSKAAVAAYKEAQRKPRTAVSTPSYTQHLRVHHYEADETDLIPAPKKPDVHHVQVEMAGRSNQSPELAVEKPKPVRVEATTKKHRFKAEKTDEARFTGSVKIATADAEELVPHTTESATTTQVAEVSKEIPNRAAPIESAAPSSRRAIAVAGPDTSGEELITIRRTHTTRGRGGMAVLRLTTVSIWLVFVCALAIGALGSEVVWRVSTDSQMAMVQFDITNIYDFINTYLDISFIR
jgi:hypothetical protein